jgi:hypothetical protein
MRIIASLCCILMQRLAGTHPPLTAGPARDTSIMADDNHRKPPWVMFLSGDEEAKPVVVQLIRDAGFDPVDLGGIDDSPLQDPGGALGFTILTHEEATALVARVKAGDTAAALRFFQKPMPYSRPRSSRVIKLAQYSDPTIGMIRA